MITVALVDDHTLLRNGLARVINSFQEYKVILETANGRDFISKVDLRNIPDVVLVDILMPQMNGFETAAWIQHHLPDVKVMALSMLSDGRSVIRMLRNGAKGYLLKDAIPSELKRALDTITRKGIYINELLYHNIVQSMNDPHLDEASEQEKARDLTEREKQFLQWLCTDKSYKEIAVAMNISPRTVDGYRDTLFEKLKVASRVGLVIFAIRNEVVRI